MGVWLGEPGQKLGLSSRLLQESRLRAIRALSSDHGCGRKKRKGQNQCLALGSPVGEFSGLTAWVVG